MNTDFLTRAAALGSRPGLERIRALLALLGNPQDSVPAVHVAGTNGKGSFCALLCACAAAAGIRTGQFCSPGLTGLADGFRIDGQPVKEEVLSCAFEHVRLAAEEMGNAPTQFELLTAAAFVLFRQERCGLAVVEAGMGGEKDATNVLAKPLLTVITGVEMDHQAFLGNTREEIAGQKAGILRRGVPVLYGAPDSVPDAIRRRAEALGAPLLRAPAVTLLQADLSGSRFRAQGREYTLSLAGLWQPENAAAVLRAAQALGLPEAAVEAGLASAHWQGRFEVMDAHPVLFDGAHNPQGTKACVASIRALLPYPVTVLTGVMADKDYQQMVRLTAPVACRVYCLKPDNPRALEPGRLAEEYRRAGCKAQAWKSFSAALSSALAYPEPVVWMGSLYAYRAFSAALHQVRGGLQ